MSDIEVLLRNADTDELRTIVGVLERANAKPAIVVTVDGGSPGGKKRRYVVAREDEHLFDNAPSGPVPEAEGTPAAGGKIRPPSISDFRWEREHHLGRFYFGCQWLRALGKVDEMYRSLGSYEICKVERIDRKKVWGA